MCKRTNLSLVTEQHPYSIITFLFVFLSISVPSLLSLLSTSTLLSFSPWFSLSFCSHRCYLFYHKVQQIYSRVSRDDTSPRTSIYLKYEPITWTSLHFDVICKKETPFPLSRKYLKQVFCRTKNGGPSFTWTLIVGFIVTLKNFHVFRS